MAKKYLYKIKQMFSQLTQEEYALAMKVCAKELGISERTFFRDLAGDSEDIPHVRFLQYCKFLSVDETDLEDFDREEITVRPLRVLKEQRDREEVRNQLKLFKK